MKKIIGLFVSTILFLSCSINDDLEYSNLENINSKITYKTATIVFDSNLDVSSLDELSKDFNVIKSNSNNNTIFWIMYNDYEISYFEDFETFINGVSSFSVTYSKYIDIQNLKVGPGEEDDVEDDELERVSGPGEEDDVEDDELERVSGPGEEDDVEDDELE